MGKGDKKTAKGKRVMGSYGNTRKKPKAAAPVVKMEKAKVKAVAEETPKKTTPKKETKAKADAPKKAPAKKVAKKEV